MNIALSKLEIDVAKTDVLNDAIEFARKHSCQSLIVSPDLVVNTNLFRGIRQGRFNVITTVDWPKGEQYGREKFRGTPTDALNVDGFEILLTARANQADINMEVKYLSEFCASYFNPLSELRFVLDIDQGHRSREHIKQMLMACRNIPAPAMIRTSHSTKAGSSGDLVNHYNDMIKFIRDIYPCKIKISGNVDHLVYQGVKADRFAVTLQQAQTIERELVSIGKARVQAALASQAVVTPSVATPPAV